VLGFTSACQQEFVGSRMCNSLDVIETTKLPANLEQGEAWVRPTLVGGVCGEIVADASRIEDQPALLSCNAWRANTSGTQGLFVDGAGRFRNTRQSPTAQEGCNIARRVACCAPVP
jgi:hypothetical protein